jgi:hypothetical protein
MHGVRVPRRESGRSASTSYFAFAANMLRCLSNPQERRNERHYTAPPRGTRPGLAVYDDWELQLGRRRGREDHRSQHQLEL